MEGLLQFVSPRYQPLARHALVLAAVIIGSIILYRFVKAGLKKAEAKGVLPHQVSSVATIFARWTVILVALVVCLQEVGMAEGAWTMLSALVAMVAVGLFAVWSTLSNFVCTLFILVFRPFEVGDEVEIMGENGIKGRVVDLTFMFTTLKDSEGGLFRIPNVSFFQKIIRCVPGSKGPGLEEQLKSKDAAE